MNPSQNKYNKYLTSYQMFESKDKKKILRSDRKIRNEVQNHNATNTADSLSGFMKATRQWNDIFKMLKG